MRPYYLPVIVFSQFAGTSLWFAGNSVISDLHTTSAGAGIANLTSFIQFGFIAGTLVFAVFMLADRFRPALIFFLSSLIAALANASVVFVADDVHLTASLRFMTGFFLAGIYPVGMKIPADWFPDKLGNALGYLVGALVLGTAFPHFLSSFLFALPATQVLLSTSLLAVSGGVLVLLTIPDKVSFQPVKFQPSAFLQVFRSPNFRAASFGYFGHMWELYTFWAFVPLLLHTYSQMAGENINTSFWSFVVIAAGCFGCIAGGIASKKYGSKKVAFLSLALSATCCILLPFAIALSLPFFLLYLLIWGFTVVSDSPQFSTLVAQSALQQYKGTALTIVTCIGFFITIISIQIIRPLLESGIKNLWMLSAGPLLGLLALRKWKRNERKNSV